MGEEFLRKGALVWLWEDSCCWMEGVCTDVQSSVYTFSCQGYGDFQVTQKELQTRTRMRIHDENVGVVDQISLLRDLGEPSMFETIRRRYNSQKIHSMIDQVRHLC